MENIKLDYLGIKDLLLDKIVLLNECGIDAEDYRELVRSIDNNVKSNIKKNNDNNVVYEDGKKNIEKLIEEINTKYGNYFYVEELSKEINELIADLNSEDIDIITSKTLVLLDNIKKCDINDTLLIDKVNKVYELIYTVIKIELLLTNDSKLLNTIRCDKTDSIFISKIIKKDIDSIDTIIFSTELNDKLSEIRKNKLDDNRYLDNELVTLLVYENNSDLVIKVKESFINTLERYDEVRYSLTKYNNQELDTKKSIKDLRKNNKKILLRGLGKCSIFLAGIGFVYFNFNALKEASAKDAYITLYKTYTSSYDSSNPDGCSYVEEYKEKTNDSLIIYEYSSWSEPGYFRDYYKRINYKYELKNRSPLFFKDVKDYFNSDYKNSYLVTESTEKVKELPEDEVPYTGNKYVASQVYQDRTDSIKKYSYNSFIVRMFSKISLVGIADVFLLVIFSMLVSNYRLGTIKGNRKTIKSYLKDLLELKNEIKETKVKLEDFKKIIDERYEKLPLYVKDNEEIKQKMLSYKLDEKEDL